MSKVLQYNYRSNKYFGDNNWHVVNIASDLPFSTTNPLLTTYADLNGQWILADSSDSTDKSIITAAGTTYNVVKSNSNRKIPNSHAIMYIYLNDDYSAGLTFKVMNRAENNYDYPTITLDDTTVLYNNKANTTSFTSITVNTSGSHIIKIDFYKDGSNDTEPDRAYLAIPKTINIQ